MEFTLRSATKADLPDILAIVNHAIATTTAHYAYAPIPLQEQQQWYDRQRAANMPVLVADDGSSVIGYGSYTQFRDRIGYRFSVEHSVYVADGCQGMGVGSALLKALIAQAKAEGRHTLIAGMDSANQGSVDFHKKHGFEEVARFREVGYKFGEWLDVIFMQLFLQD